MRWGHFSGGVSDRIRNNKARLERHLREYQRDGVEFIRRAPMGAILFWDMRTGKTRTALLAPKSFRRIVIVAPKVTQGVWVEESKEVLGLEPYVIEGRAYADLPEDEHVFWINYEIVGGRWSWFLHNPIDVLVLDEAQMIKNKRAQRTQAVHALSGCAKKTVALTGTPIYNRPADLWGLLWAVQPGEWPAFYDFARRYCNGRPTGYGGFDATGFSRRHKRELQGRLEEVVHRVRWKDIVDSVPKLDRIRVPVVMKRKDREECRRLTRDLREALDGYEGPASPNVAARLRQTSKLRMAIGRAKVHPTVEFIDTIPESEKVVIWTHHHEVAEAITDKLRPRGGVARLHGRMASAKRRAQLAYFDNKARFIVVSLEAGGVGIDLSASRIAVFAELSWTPAILAQAERRTYKGTEERLCAMYYIVASGTVEDRILDVLEEKVRLVYDALDDAELLTMVSEVAPQRDDVIGGIVDAIHKRSEP